MRHSITAAVPLLCCALAASSQELSKQAPVPPITLTELNRRGVTGSLGIPLGTVCEIEAEIISGDSLSQKGYSSVYLLNVAAVNGKHLERPRMFEFSIHPVADMKLPNDNWSLYEFKHGKKALSLNAEKIKELETGYIGSTVHLIVYEAGSFSGIPDNLPKDFPVWQGRRIHFSTSLTVLERKK